MGQKIVGLNRRHFIDHILNEDFNGRIKDCAVKIGISERCLHDLIFEPTRRASSETLNLIYQYCRDTGRNPLEYILKDA